MRVTILGLSLGLGVASAEKPAAKISPAAQVAQAETRGDVARGKTLFTQKGCYLCHGHFGQGGNFDAPTPAVAKYPLSYEEFKEQVRASKKVMPAFAEAVLSERDVADLYAFVQALPGKRNPEEIPLLKGFVHPFAAPSATKNAR